MCIHRCFRDARYICDLIYARARESMLEKNRARSANDIIEFFFAQHLSPLNTFCLFSLSCDQIHGKLRTILLSKMSWKSLCDVSQSGKLYSRIYL